MSAYTENVFKVICESIKLEHHEKKIFYYIFVLGISHCGFWSNSHANFVVPGVLGLATINFWQALALFVLARIFFGGFPGRGAFPARRGMPGGKEGNPFRAKWEKMSPEERKDFINKRKKFGFGGPFGRDGFFNERNFDRNNGSETPKENE